MENLSLSNKTIRGLHTMLRQCLEQAVTERLIPYNPANGCRLPKKEKKNMQNRIMLCDLLAACGISTGELVGLRQFCGAFGFEVRNNGATAIIRTK